MNNPCDVHVDCFPCFESPINNFSAEDPDPLVFSAGSYGGGVPPDGPFIPNGPVPPGTPPIYWAEGCLTYCVSIINQQDADLCAARQSYACNKDRGNIPGTPAPGQPNFSPVFFSNSVTCCKNCPDGLSFCFTLPAGLFVANSQILADRQAQSYACRLATVHKICMSNIEPGQACNNSGYTGTIRASGNFLDPDANLWEITAGSLPPGLTFNGGFKGLSVTVTGIPTQQGIFTFTVRVTAPGGDFMEKPISLCVIDITSIPAGSTPDSLPAATLNSPYGVTLTVPGCAQAPISYQITDGALPAGLSINESTGIIAGIPTSGPASFVFTVTVQTNAT